MSDYSPESRAIELEALKRVANYYPSTHAIIDLGDSDVYDFEIRNSNHDLIGIGEVSWLEDPVKRSAWTALLNQEEHHIIPLKSGQGFWAMSIKHTAHIRTITNRLPGLIELMLNLNETDRQIYETWPHDDISKALRELGIEYLRKVVQPKSDQDQCFFMLEGSGGVIPDSLEPLADFLVELVNTKFSDCLKKLDVGADLDKHLYFQMGSYLPFNLTEPLGLHNAEVEIGRFNFPVGITHIWLIGSNENYRSVLWRNSSISHSQYL